MAVLTIRDVPDDVKNALAETARERGQSLQAFLLNVLIQQSRFARNRQLIEEIERTQAADPEGWAGDDAPNSAEVLAQERARRTGNDGVSEAS